MAEEKEAADVQHVETKPHKDIFGWWKKRQQERAERERMQAERSKEESFIKNDLHFILIVAAERYRHPGIYQESVVDERERNGRLTIDLLPIPKSVSDDFKWVMERFGDLKLTYADQDGNPTTISFTNPLPGPEENEQFEKKMLKMRSFIMPLIDRTIMRGSTLRNGVNEPLSGTDVINYWKEWIPTLQQRYGLKPDQPGPTPPPTQR